jgi:hypothetical protein
MGPNGSRSFNPYEALYVVTPLVQKGKDPVQGIGPTENTKPEALARVISRIAGLVGEHVSAGFLSQKGVYITIGGIYLIGTPNTGEEARYISISPMEPIKSLNLYYPPDPVPSLQQRDKYPVPCINLHETLKCDTQCLNMVVDMIMYMVVDTIGGLRN